MEKIVNRIILITLFFAVLFAGLAYKFRFAEHDSVINGERTFSACDYIDINLGKLPVTFLLSDEEDIRAVFKNDLPLEFSLGDNSLSISESSRFTVSLFTGDRGDYGLYIYLPRRHYREISVYTDRGDVTFGGVDTGLFTAVTESGNITCENLTAQVKITTTSGFIKLDFDDVAKDSEVLSREGDALFELPEGVSALVNFTTNSGYCSTDMWGGMMYGSYRYSFNGGERNIDAAVNEGVLTIKEKANEEF